MLCGTAPSVAFRSIGGDPSRNVYSMAIYEKVKVDDPFPDTFERGKAIDTYLTEALKLDSNSQDWAYNFESITVGNLTSLGCIPGVFCKGPMEDILKISQWVLCPVVVLILFGFYWVTTDAVQD